MYITLTTLLYIYTAAPLVRSVAAMQAAEASKAQRKRLMPDADTDGTDSEEEESDDMAEGEGKRGSVDKWRNEPAKPKINLDIGKGNYDGW